MHINPLDVTNRGTMTALITVFALLFGCIAVWAGFQLCSTHSPKPRASSGEAISAARDANHSKSNHALRLRYWS